MFSPEFINYTAGKDVEVEIRFFRGAGGTIKPSKINNFEYQRVRRFILSKPDTTKSTYHYQIWPKHNTRYSNGIWEKKRKIHEYTNTDYGFQLVVSEEDKAQPIDEKPELTRNIERYSTTIYYGGIPFQFDLSRVETSNNDNKYITYEFEIEFKPPFDSKNMETYLEAVKDGICILRDTDNIYTHQELYQFQKDMMKTLGSIGEINTG